MMRPETALARWRPRRLLVGLFMVSWLACFPTAHAEQMSLHEFGQPQGLSNLAVNALVQDADGFIWIGTENGLYRKDSQRIERIDKVTKLGNIQALASDGTRLWIGTREGLWTYDGITLTPIVAAAGQTLPVDQPQAIAITQKAVFVASGGHLYAVDARPSANGWLAREVDRSGFREDSQDKGSVLVVLADKSRNLWFGCGANICHLHDGETQVFGPSHGVPRDEWHSLMQTTDGSLWGRGTRHIVQLIQGTGDFVARGQDNTDPLGHYPLVEDAQHRVLTARRDGLIRWNGSAWEHFDQKAGLPSTARISALLVDSEGGFWLAIKGSGLLEWQGYGRWENWSRTDGLPHNVTWGFARIPFNRDGHLHAATGAGIVLWQPDLRRFSLLPDTARIEAFDLGVDGWKSLWVRTATAELLPVRPNAAAPPESLTAPPVERAIYHPRLDLTTDLWLIDRQTLSRRPVPGDTQPATQLRLPSTLGGAVTDVCQETKDKLWLASDDGVYRHVEGAWTKVALIRSALLSCADDGSVIVGGEVDGLWSIDDSSPTPTVRDITPATLQRRLILAMRLDSRGWLWVGSDAGVAVWNRRLWRHLETTDGLIWNDISAGALFEDFDHSIWIGTSRGMSHLLHPEKLFETSLPPLHLSSIRLGQTSLPIGAPVSLPAKHEVLEVTLTSTGFRDSHAQSIEYRLVGWDEQWIGTDNGRVTLSALPAGHYRFEARLSHPDLAIVSPAIGFSVVVATPWWATPTALSAFCLAAVLAGYAVYRWRIRSLQHHERALAALVTQRTAELATARDEAEAANRAKNDFIARMSHELRTPLNGILGYAQLLQRDAPLDNRQSRGLEVIQRSGEYLLSLINDLLDLAKIEAGKVRNTPIALAIEPFLRTVADIIAVRAAAKNLQFRCETAPDLPTAVLLDERLLRQTLLNLLTNAIKFTQRGGITLQVTQPAPGRLRFAVDDTGVGIAAGQQDTIFQPFEQVSETQQHVGGVGLGLAISREFVRAMGGNLYVNSRPGAGSTFWFDLDAHPTAPPETPARAQEIQPPEQISVTKRILVVEDIADNRTLLKDTLEPLGFSVVMAGNGREGIALAESDPPDLILMDAVMPDMDGLSATRSLRAKPGFDTVPIVMLTAQAMARDRNAALAAGATAFVTKPFDLNELLSVILMLLGMESGPGNLVESPKLHLSDGPRFKAPAAEQMARLHQAAREGDMAEIRRQASWIGGLDDSYRPFADRLLELAAQYQSKAILQLVELHLRHSD